MLSIEAMKQLVLHLYPDWQGVSDPRFVEDEITYKRNAAQTARELLSRDALLALIEAGQYEELQDRVKRVGQAGVNLLYLQNPRSGDLSAVYGEHIKQPEFWRAFVELLYGESPAPERIDQFVAVLESHGASTKWTFLTYFLFLLHPESDLFVKPSVFKWLWAFAGEDGKLPSKPSGEVYVRVLALGQQIREGFASYGVRDMIDVQSIIWVAYHVANKDSLAAPFNALFSDLGQANWAFDFMRDAAQSLGVVQPDDTRAAFTAPRKSGWQRLRFNFGTWLILGFAGREGSLETVEIVLLDDDRLQIDCDKSIFKQPDDGPGVQLYYLPLAEFERQQGLVLEIFEKTLDVVRQRFRNRRVGLHSRYNNLEVARAVFDEDAREALIRQGFTSSSKPYFDRKAFELLERLEAAPFVATYNADKDAYEQYVITPFKRLMQEVAAQLRPEVRAGMETEKRIFSSIPKNDYGQGGAWPYYWGAFYAGGKTRTQAAQLFVGIHPDLLWFGFHIGEHEQELKERLEENAEKYADELAEPLEDSIPTEITERFRQFYAEQGQPDRPAFTWEAWLKNVELFEHDVRIKFAPDEVLAMPASELVATIAEVHNSLYPLVLLATQDDPMPAIRAYLGAGDGASAPYPLDQLAEDTGLGAAELERWIRALERKGQIVLYGPPGTGKTYVAERLARHLTSQSDGFVELVQFHPGYAYEDFMQGIRPVVDDASGTLTYEVQPGRFLEFCTRAARRSGPCVLIIDEINRANLSRVFGELMYLLEYRDREIPLAGGGRFRIPGNVRLIGTMNTADRSIALVDHALRRRFAFIALQPSPAVLRHYHARNGTGFSVDGLIGVLKDVNKAINDPHFAVGHSFFLRPDLPDQIEDIWRMEIEPYLEEYFFDRRDVMNQYRWQAVKGDIMP